ncbi:hypothetical protein PG5_40700 [Pseudomonas sp. G5(2012)]|nr:hypothetical protein PG5_40700 [Pseudomonas sp. G5(2012)]
MVVTLLINFTLKGCSLFFFLCGRPTYSLRLASPLIYGDHLKLIGQTYFFSLFFWFRTRFFEL